MGQSRKNTCTVTGVGLNQILIASHIVAWKDATNEERLDVENGILLSPVYDALFDKHLVSFDKRGHIILSKTVSMKTFQQLGVNGNECIENLSPKNIEYLKRHRVL